MICHQILLFLLKEHIKISKKSYCHQSTGCGLSAPPEIKIVGSRREAFPVLAIPGS
jgi:hypothetical protein